MQIGSTKAASPPNSTAPKVAIHSKIPTKSKAFRFLLGSGVATAHSERPVGAAAEGAMKRIAPYPTHRGPTEGLARQSKDGVVKEADPLDRSGQCFDPLALLASPVAFHDAAPSREFSPSPVWVSETIRRIAWGGDRQRGTARIELGAGPYAGSALQVQAEGGALTLEVTAPPGVDATALVEHIGERLRERGLRIESVRVR